MITVADYSLLFTLSLAFIAGLSIPFGAVMAAIPAVQKFCVEKELDSFLSYFGGGALMAAISLVLIPRGMAGNTLVNVALWFSFGGLIFWLFSEWTIRSNNSFSQFVAMLLDFIPETILLGSAAANGSRVALLLAFMIILQNMPEGFNAFIEMRENKQNRINIWGGLLLATLLGPIAAGFGYSWLADRNQLLSAILLFCSGGILYLIFQDIAPKANVERKGFPAIGSISGFLLGMLGSMILH